MIEIVGLAARYGVVHAPGLHFAGFERRLIRFAPLALHLPDGGVPFLVDHDPECRVGWVNRAVAHDDFGLAILATVRDYVRLPWLGLSIRFVSFAHYESVEQHDGVEVATYARAWITEVSNVRTPGCPGAGISGWRPVVGGYQFISSSFERDVAQEGIAA